MKKLFLLFLITPIVARMNNVRRNINPINIAYNNAQIKSTDLNHAASDGMYVITVPGYYFLANDLRPNPTKNNVACIKIKTSNVILDLNGKTIVQFSSGGGKQLTGIEIDEGLADIQVKNGIINGISGNGITISPDTMSIKLEHLTITNCEHYGIELKETSNIEIQDIHIKRCTGTALKCAQSSKDGAIGIYINNSRNISLVNVKSNSHIHATKPAAGFLVTKSQECHFTNCSACNNQGTQSFGFLIEDDISNCDFNQCYAANNISTAHDSYGFYFLKADYSQITQSQSLANIAEKGNAYGFYFKESRGNIINNCSIRGNSVTEQNKNVYGFYGLDIIGFRLHNCQSFSQTSEKGNAFGFYLKNAHSNSIIKSNAKDMDATKGNGNAYGFYSETGFCNNLSKCKAIGNRGGKHNDSIGAGFALVEGESSSTIIQSESNGNTCGPKGKDGTAYGILLNGTVKDIEKSQIKQCSFSNNQGKKSYGYCDTSSNSSTLLTANISFGQGKCLPVTAQLAIVDKGANNYMFNFTDPDKNPANIILETNIANLQVTAASTPHMNISVVS